MSPKIEKDEVIFVDRIFAPTHLEQVEEFDDPNHYFIFLTQSGVGWRNNEAEYPFSVTYMLNCFKRCIER